MFWGSLTFSVDEPLFLREEQMNELRVTATPEQLLPDGGFETKYGTTTYQVSVFFDHEGGKTAEDRIKRVIREEVLKEIAEK